MDIKAKIDELVKKITSDKKLMANFKKEPVKTIEKLIGIDLPDEQIEKIVDGVKAKIGLDSITDKLSGIAGLFGKK